MNNVVREILIAHIWPNSVHTTVLTVGVPAYRDMLTAWLSRYYLARRVSFWGITRCACARTWSVSVLGLCLTRTPGYTRKPGDDYIWNPPMASSMSVSVMVL